MRLLRRFRPASMAAAAVAMVFLVPGLAAATISGPCTASGTSTSGTVDLTTATEWHMLSTDTAGGQGQSTVTMTEGSVSAYGLGIAIPIAGGTGNGDTQGSVDGVQVSTYAILGHRFTVKGSASGEAASCAGQVTVILDDVDPLFTVFGGGALVLALIMVVAILVMSRAGDGCFVRLLCGGAGALAGAGVALASEQWGVSDPTSAVIGLAALIVGALIGVFIPTFASPDKTPTP